MLSLHHHPQPFTPCSCGVSLHLCKVTCHKCLQAEFLCSQCWLDKHRTMPTH
ncbi:hypothetical protein B0H17DRAFT_914631 [Mycena rosella]|uniref:Uncharacterized protein n=1 Tax=Mycena rosella TaxID=1033263 RepID=A0AAD7H2H3_MYCRO|nr:hypothetical protein B0H17DRAFT_914631 [Mycena rosella]